MRLHPILPNSEIPECLKRKLVFGDREQISALHDLEIKIEKIEKETKQEVTGTLKKFQVRISYRGSEDFTIYAKDKKAAEEQAEELEVDPWGFDTEIEWIDEIKDK